MALPELGERALQQLSHGSYHVIDDIVPTLLNDLAEITHEPALILVLDDFHVIDHEDILASLDYFLRYLPESIQVVISSRTKPELSVISKSGWGDVAMINMDHLRFTAKETAYLLHQFLGSIEDQQSHHITRITEGWAVGIQLLAQHVQQHDPFAVSQDITDASQQLNSKIVEMSTLQNDVLSGFDSDTRTLLASIAFLPKFCSELCAHIWQDDKRLASLKRLIAHNHFIIPIESDHQWYRLHELIRIALLDNTHGSNNNSQRMVVRNAIQWLLEKNDVETALQLAVEHGQWDQAIHCVHSVVPAWRSQGYYQRVSEFIEKLPREIICQNLGVLSNYGWSLANLDRFEVAYYYLDIGSAMLESKLSEKAIERWDSVSQSEAIHLMITVSIVYRLSGNYSVEHSLRTLSFAKKAGFSSMSKVYLELGQDAFMCGKLAQAQKALDKALTHAIDEGEPYAIVIAAVFFLFIGKLCGNALTMLDKLDLAHHCLKKSCGTQTPFSCLLALFQAVLELEKGGEVANDSRITQALLLANSGVARHTQWLIHYLHLQFQYAMGQDQEAQQTLHQLQQIENKKPLIFLVATPHSAALWADHHIRMGEVNKVESWLSTAYIDPIQDEENRQQFVQQEERLILARALWFTRRFDAASAHAQIIVKHSLQQGNKAHYLRARFISVACLLANHQEHTAEKLFTDTINNLQELELMHLFREQLQQYPHVVSLAVNIPMAPYLHAVVAEILAANPASGIRHAAALPEHRLLTVEGLSSRELEVLQAVSDGLSNPEIADRLVISINTVKTHLQKIYEKFQVKSRTQALLKAQQMDLI